MTLHLLSRHAENYFWLGRYVERSASMSRLVQVQTAFDRGRADGTGWAWLLTLYDQLDDFDERYGAHGGRSADNVIAYCLTDQSHFGSVASTLAAAHLNARGLRALISTDFWIQINRLRGRVRNLPVTAVHENRLAQTCQQIQTDAYALLGIAESTFYRDSGWRFFCLGVEVERADQMSRLLDVRFAQLSSGVADAGPRYGDFAFWTLLLRSCGGHHAYRRTRPGKIESAAVAEFLIFDRSFARSISHCVEVIESCASELRTVCQLPTPSPVLTRIAELNDLLHTARNDAALVKHLHAFNDTVQRQLADLTLALSDHYFDTTLEPPAAPDAAATKTASRAAQAADTAAAYS